MSTEPSCFVLVLNFEFHIGIVVYIFKGSVLLPKSCFFRPLLFLLAYVVFRINVVL